MSVKNPTLRRRTKELTECVEDARECQLLAYELKDIGRLIEGMAIHMGDLQRKVDSQAEHIKMLNEKLTADTPQTNCDKCIWSVCNYNKVDWDADTPQTETDIAKAIVHKMIDDAVIAEDAYPDLRQKMHDAVDEYEPQTERSE